MTESAGGGQHSPGFLRFEATIALRAIIVVAAFLLAIWLTLQVTIIAVGAFIGFALASLLWPAVEWLTQWIPRTLASIAAIAVAAGAIVGLSWFIVAQLIEATPQLFSALAGSVSAVNDWFVERGWALPQDSVDNIEEQLTSRLGDLASGIGGAAVSGLQWVSSAGTIILVGIFAALFALISGRRMVRGMVGMVPARRQLSFFGAVQDAAHTARWWVIASSVTGAVDGLFIGVGMALLGVPLAVPIGLATFILAFIPMIGATVAGALAVAVALFFNGFWTALWVLIIVLVVQQIEGNLLSPLLLSRAMDFPPLVTLLLSTGGGIALGLPGLFLAVPVAGVITAMMRAWRRNLPDDVKKREGIGEAPKPTFDDLKDRVLSKDDSGDGDRDDDGGDDAGGDDHQDPEGGGHRGSVDGPGPR